WSFVLLYLRRDGAIERRKVFQDGAPDAPFSDIFVVVPQDISDSHDRPPGQLWMAVANLGREAPRGLQYDFGGPRRGVKRLPVAREAELSRMSRSAERTLSEDINRFALR